MMYWLQRDHRQVPDAETRPASDVPPGQADPSPLSAPGRDTPEEPDDGYQSLLARIEAFEVRHPSLTGRKTDDRSRLAF